MHSRGRPSQTRNLLRACSLQAARSCLVQVQYFGPYASTQTSPPTQPHKVQTIRPRAAAVRQTAKRDIGGRQLTSPRNNNANAKYHTLLKLDPVDAWTADQTRQPVRNSVARRDRPLNAPLEPQTFLLEFPELAPRGRSRYVSTRSLTSAYEDPKRPWALEGLNADVIFSGGSFLW